MTGISGIGGIGMGMGGSGLQTMELSSISSGLSSSTGGEISTQHSVFSGSQAHMNSGPMNARMGELVQTMNDFTSAEILMALMLMAAMNQDDDKKSGGGAALGVLAGMALTGQLGQSFDQFSNSQHQFQVQAIGSQGAGGLGMQMDLQI